jgi:hypothetical protein
MTTVWDIPADDLLAHLGEGGENWIKGQYNDEYGSMCLHGAIRMCDLKPGDAYVIEEVANRQGWGPSWNDAMRTTWGDIVARIVPGITITDDMLADTFGPNWATILEYVRSIATVTRQQAHDAADLDDGRYDVSSRLLDEWSCEQVHSLLAAHPDMLMDWVSAAANVVHHIADGTFERSLNIAFAQIAKVLACRHLILKDGYSAWYLNVTAQARDLFGPLHPDDPE